MKYIKLYIDILFRKNVDSSVWNMKLSQAFLVLIINVGFHSLFSLQVFVMDSYPSFTLLKIPGMYYYLIQAIALYPISIQLYLIMSSVIYLFINKDNLYKYEEILKICINTVSIPIGIIFAMPCIILYLLLGYKMAAFVPLFSTAAFIWAYIRLYQYLCVYIGKKSKIILVINLLALILAFSLEVLIVR